METIPFVLLLTCVPLVGGVLCAKKAKFFKCVQSVCLLFLAASVSVFLVSCQSKSYFETDVMVDSGENTDHVVIQGVNYYALSFDADVDIPLGDAVAYWDHSSKFSHLLDQLSGEEPDELLYGLLYGYYYSVPNEQNFDMISNGISSYVLVSERDYEAAHAWYTNPDNYFWYLKNYNHIDEKNTQKVQVRDLTQDEIMTLDKLSRHVEGDPIEVVLGFADETPLYSLFRVSRDGVVEKGVYEFDLFYYEGTFYQPTAPTSGPHTRTYYLYPIPESVNSLLLEGMEQLKPAEG